MVIPGIGGFAGGALHPILVLSHALALIALATAAEHADQPAGGVREKAGESLA